jgi:hypothetical protein
VYGKIFASMYEGSMVGSGPVVFSVWGYCIAKADTDGTVLLNPALLAPVIGTSRTEIERAIEFLESPDEHSKNPDHEGRRLLRQTGHLYFVVSHAVYREMKSNEDRREYMREYMRRKRGQEAVNINKVNTELTEANPASVSSSPSNSQEGGCKGETAGDAFERFWNAYGYKVKKGTARKSFAVALKKTTLDVMLAAIDAQRKTASWKDGYQQHPSTWLNSEGWDNDIEAMNRRAEKKTELPNTWHGNDPTLKNAW